MAPRETLEEFLARGGTVEKVRYPTFEEIRVPTAAEAMQKSMRMQKAAAYRRRAAQQKT